MDEMRVKLESEMEGAMYEYQAEQIRAGNLKTELILKHNLYCNLYSNDPMGANLGSFSLSILIWSCRGRYLSDTPSSSSLTSTGSTITGPA
jgi:hypothetical protein